MFKIQPLRLGTDTSNSSLGWASGGIATNKRIDSEVQPFQLGRSGSSRIWSGVTDDWCQSTVWMRLGWLDE